MRNFWGIYILFVFVFFSACSGENSCDPNLDECEFLQVFPEITLAPGQEDDTLCQSWSLNNETELWVRSVQFENDGAYHHSNWFYVPDNKKVYARADGTKVPDGVWNCNTAPASPFQELQAAILGGFLFAQSTQTLGEDQRFSGGGALRIPPHSRIIGSTHLLNALDRSVKTSSRMRLSTLPPHAVTAKLAPARIEYHDLKIQPQSKSQFSTSCNIKNSYKKTMEKELSSFFIYYVLPHYHDLGFFTELSLVGGERDGEVIFRNDGAPGEVLGRTFDPPLDIIGMGAEGLKLTCGYMNPSNDVVKWGIGDQEMCVMAIFADSDFAFQRFRT